MKVCDNTHGGHVAPCAIVQHKKTGRPVKFKIAALVREAAEAWIKQARLGSDDYVP